MDKSKKILLLLLASLGIIATLYIVSALYLIFHKDNDGAKSQPQYYEQPFNGINTISVLDTTRHDNDTTDIQTIRE